MSAEAGVEEEALEAHTCAAGFLTKFGTIRSGVEGASLLLGVRCAVAPTAGGVNALGAASSPRGFGMVNRTPPSIPT